MNYEKNLSWTLRNNVTALLFKFIFLFHELPLIRGTEHQPNMQTHMYK